MLQFIAKVKSFDTDLEGNPINQIVNDTLILSAESFEAAMGSLEGWFGEELMSASLTCLTNKSWVIIDEEIANRILDKPENHEFW